MQQTQLPQIDTLIKNAKVFNNGQPAVIEDVAMRLAASDISDL